MKTELSEITPILKSTIINKEDKYFYYHPGINIISIVKAAFNNIIYRKKTSGASTITMQVVRLTEPRRRTYPNKVIELFRALQLEWHYSKEEILQQYLNNVPYGSNIEGVKAASVIYFKQNPDYLSLAQVVTLAIIPNRPSSLVLGKNNEKIITERNKWLKRFAEQKLFPQQDIEDAELEPLTAVRNPVPKMAPHFAYRLLKMYPHDAIIHTNLSMSKQEQIQNITYNYVRSLKSKGITNAAVLLIDNRNNKVISYIGSADFFNRDDAGQVDGVQSIRSPGSALKPMVYALGFEKGLITPATMLSDVPFDYKGYNPKNFDSEYHGQVTAEAALSRSLNVPAVKMLNDIGLDAFTNRMITAGFSDFKKRKSQMGLSAILGGCGVTLEEITRLYTCFAHEGKMFPLEWELKKNSETSSKQNISGSQICTPEATFLVNNILTQLIRPDLPNNYQSSYHLPKIAWKTGTSYGRRDAWSIGYNRDYTLGVWVGNFDGSGAPDLSGADVATPLLFDIFNTIAYNSSNDWFQAPKGIDFRVVCSETGLPPNDFCTDEKVDYFIPSVSSNQKCNHLKEVFISTDGLMSYCRDCCPQEGFKTKMYPNLSPELISFYDEQNIPYEKIPEHNPNCTKMIKGLAPQITSPADEAEYIFEKDGGRELLLSCNAANDVKKIYWYVSDKYYKSCASNEKIFYKPVSAGQYKISCADDKGRNCDIEITVTIL